jgi:hypothetical protein
MGAHTLHDKGPPFWFWSNEGVKDAGVRYQVVHAVVVVCALQHE